MSEEDLEPKLSQVNLDGIVEYIRSHPGLKIIVMQGAGVSTAAGIPDFRTPGTGLYSNLQKYGLPQPEAIFDIGYFVKRPEPFFALSRELVPGSYQPTIAHYFPVLLHSKGLLERVYTQNIDGLERIAGVPEELLVEAHGTFQTWHCLKCKTSFKLDEHREEFTSGKVVRCETCSGLVKPDVVFFGEQLPDRFYDLVGKDFPACDLLIILGTSLAVHPFCLLIEYVRKDVPRVLLNMEQVAVASENDETGNGFKFDHETNTRDVFLGGPCDESVLDFVTKLGWKEEFMKLLPPSLQQKVREIESKDRETKTKTEKKGTFNPEPKLKPKPKPELESESESEPEVK